MSIVQLSGWQSAQASVGSRFRYMFLAESRTTPITTRTVNEAKRVLAMRTQVKILDVKLLGRVLQVDMESRVARNLLALLPEYLVAGDPAVTFRATVVFAMPGAQSMAGAIAGRVGDAASYVANPLDWRLSQDVRDMIDKVVPDAESVGSGIGNTLANVIKPLMIPLVLGAVAYTVLLRKVG